MIEEFLSALRGEVTGTPAWTADLSYWIAGRQQDGSADPSWRTEEGYLELHRDLGVMPYYCYDKFWTAEPVCESDVEMVSASKGRCSFRELRTPAGTIREESKYLVESSCYGVTRHMVQQENDLDILLCALNKRKLIPINLDDYAERRERWARFDGLPCLGLPRSPLPALACEWCGLEGLVLLLLEHEEKVLEALSLMESQEAPAVDAVCELRPPLIHFPGNLSSENLTGFSTDTCGNRIQEDSTGFTLRTSKRRFISMAR